MRNYSNQADCTSGSDHWRFNGSIFVHFSREHAATKTAGACTTGAHVTSSFYSAADILFVDQDFVRGTFYCSTEEIESP